MRAAAGDDVRHTAGSGSHSLEHWAAIHPGVLDDQAAHVRGSQIFGVAQRALDELLKHAGAALRLVAQDRERIVDRHPRHENVVFTAGLSGHGFKFTPVLGRAMADLALDGKSDLPIEFLSLKRLG